MNNQIYSATISKFIAQREEAIAVLSVYFNNSVGIGEHSNFLEDTVKWTKKLAEADECIKVLSSVFTPLQSDTADTEDQRFKNFISFLWVGLKDINGNRKYTE